PFASGLRVPIMPTDAKLDAVRVLADLRRGSSAIAVADYRGLQVSEMQTVRRTLRANGVELHVAKNRLLKIAADEADRADLKPMLDGPTPLATSARSGRACWTLPPRGRRSPATR